MQLKRAPKYQLERKMELFSFCNKFEVSIRQENSENIVGLCLYYRSVFTLQRCSVESFAITTAATNSVLQLLCWGCRRRAHSASPLSAPLTCKCPPAIRHQQRAARGGREGKRTTNWNVNSNFWHARDIWESRAASREGCKKGRARGKCCKLCMEGCVCVWDMMEVGDRVGDGVMEQRRKGE